MSQSRYSQATQTNWSIFNLFLLAVNLAIVVLLVLRYWSAGEHLQGPIPGDKSATLHPEVKRDALTSDDLINIGIFEQVSPCTVHVSTYLNRRDPSSFDILKIPQGTGTGFIWDSWERNGKQWGRIVTNYHVIANARRDNGKIDPGLIQVTLADHSSWRVVDVNFAEDRDLAVLWTDAPADRLKFIKLGKSNKLKVGQKVYAIGNPFGLDQTMTHGIISALGREIRTNDSNASLRGLIQTDASINPGNSGGPLLDSAGLLIGVNTAIVSPSGASVGIGFAIPEDDVNRVVTRLIRKDVVLRPALGIGVAADQVMRRIGQEGVLVLHVDADGPAARAGIKATRFNDDGTIVLGDIITAIDGKKIRSNGDLLDVLDSCKVGQEVQVSVLRGDKTENLKATLIGVSK